MPDKKNTIRALLTVLVLHGPWGPVVAGEDTWSLCRGPEYKPFVIPPQAPGEPRVNLEADKARFNEISGEAEFSGNVDLEYGYQRLASDDLRYLRDQEQYIATGHVVYQDLEQGLAIDSQRAELNSETEYVRFSDAQYRYTPRHAHGKAKRIFRKSADVVQLNNATYTTCNPGDNAWMLSGKKVTLDRASGRGHATQVIFRIKDVPIFYSPWLEFPIDDRRKTGFLSPTVGTTENSGTEIITPFYWNIAPNYDMTITPRYLSRRGLQIKTENRYLFPRTDTGILKLEYLNDSKAHQKRWLVDFKHKTSLTPHWKADVTYRDVSDSRYYEDLGSSLGQSSLTHLLQNADFNFSNGPWRLLARVQNFKTIDDTISTANRPYKRLPQFLGSVSLPDRRFGLGYSLRGEWVNFDKDDALTGRRLDAQVGVDWPFVRPGYYAIPKAQLRYTRYDLNNTGDRFRSSPSRTLPILSLDSGLIFERPIGDSGTVQTIEPRLYYLYVPFEDQDNLPVFDTSQFEFTFSQLFRDNEFTGADRLSNANQLTTALTSRWIDTVTGSQKLSASIGQIFYFSNKKVTLPNLKPDTNSSSNIVGNLTADLDGRWLASATTQWDPHGGTHVRTAARLRYKARHNRIINLGYSFRDGQFKQTDVSFSWPVTPSWHLVGRWNYDLRNTRNVQILGGVEYESCCWAVRLAARRYITNTDEEFNTSVMVQVVFKGLTQLGSNIGALLKRNVVGYEEEF